MIKLINNVGGGARRLGLKFPSLNGESLKRQAQKITGVHDCGGFDWEEGYGRLLRALRGEAHLNQMGRIMARQMIIRTLRTRLIFFDYINKNPEVNDEEIKAPIFILGMPRAATSVLHYLLNEDPANRSPLHWETTFPTPSPPTPETYCTDARIKNAEDNLNNFFRLIPNFQAMHDFDHTTPQECINITNYNFASFLYSTLYMIPEYTKWITESDLIETYRFHKLFLQYLQHGGVRGQWVLKSPVHMYCLDQIFEVYPDAKIIQTHRDPLRVVASATSLKYATVQATTDVLNMEMITNEELKTWARWLDMNVVQRKKYNKRSNQFYDLYFRDYVKSPMGSIKKIYQKFGLKLTSEARKRILDHMVYKPNGRFGKHKYSEEEFGLSKEKHQGHFKEYLEYFGPV